MKDYFLISNPNSYSIIVNKKYKLEDNYSPKDLTMINKRFSSKEIYLRKKVKNSFEKMAKKAKKLNLILIAVSGYRSSKYQDTLFKNYVKEKGYEYASICSAKPGFSEHQTGLALDIANDNLDYDNFEYTKEF